MPSRRPHTKTRHGCATCKARRIRCDETRPICRNCSRGDRSCGYPNQVLVTRNAPDSVPKETQDQVFPSRDMDLLHHYTACSFKVFTNEDYSYPVWQVYVPQLASCFPFLLHGLLAIAALHLRYDAEGTEKPALMTLARHHQQRALAQFIPLLQQINRDDCEALFTFSIVQGVLCFGMLNEHDDESQSLTRHFAEVFDTLTGAAAVAVEAKDWLSDTRIATIMHGLAPPLKDLSVLEEIGMQNALRSLLDCAERMCPSEVANMMYSIGPSSRLEAYRSSIYGVCRCLAPMASSSQRLSAVVSWAITAGCAYIALLRQHDSLAVTILGHYGVALHLLHGQVWVMDGLGKRLVDAVTREVGESWQTYLAFAKWRVNNAPATLVEN